MRVSRKVLQSRVDYLNQLFGFKDGGPTMFQLDHHQPGGNTHTWKVVYGNRRELQNGRWYYLESQSAGPSHRMTASECEVMLNGMIWGIEHATQRGFNAYRIDGK